MKIRVSKICKKKKKEKDYPFNNYIILYFTRVGDYNIILRELLIFKYIILKCKSCLQMVK